MKTKRTKKSKFEIYQWSAFKFDREFTLTPKEFAVKADSPCAICGELEPGSIDRLDYGAGYTTTNTIPCCDMCKTARQSLPMADFRDWLKRVSNMQKAVSEKTQS